MVDRARVVVTAACVLAGSALLIGMAYPLLTGTLAVLVILVAMVPVTAQWIRGRVDLLEIVHPIMLQYAIYIGFRTFYLLPDQFALEGAPDFRDAVDMALAVALSGMIAFLAGYYLPSAGRVSRRIGSTIQAVPLERVQVAVFVLFACGLLCRLWIIATGGYLRFMAWDRESSGGGGMAIEFLAYSSYYALALGAAAAMHPDCSRAFRAFLWGLLTPVTILLAASSGSKTDVIWLIFAMLFARHYVVRPIGFRAVAVTAAVIALVIFPVITAYRGVMADGGGSSATDVVVSTAHALQPADDGFWSSSIAALSGRSAGLETLAILIKYMPQLGGFEYGRTLIMAPVIAFVPTFVWPAKYEFLETKVSGAELARVYFGYADNISGVPNTQVGELYMNFGWMGVVVGMFILGYWCRFVYRTFLATRTHATAILMYLFVFVYIVPIDGWIAYHYGVLPKQLAITGIIACLLGSVRLPLRYAHRV